MKSILRYNWLIPLIISVITLLSGVYSRFNNRQFEARTIMSDGKGYYAYLPAVFIYHDSQMSFLKEYEKKYYGEGSYFDFRSKIGDSYADKYFCGTALLILPFFWIAHLIAAFGGYPPDGYSPPYQVTMIFAGAFYLFGGLYFLFRLLKSISTEVAAAITISVIALGTNLYHYAVIEPTMSHVFAFALATGICFQLYRYFQSFNFISIYLIALFGGILTVVRPVDLLVFAFIPFFAGSKQNLINGFKFLFKQPFRTVFACVIALLPVLVQMALWYWQTGRFYIYSYQGEGFEFNDPDVGFVLFSYTKGWFLWTPIAFAGICGLIYLVRINLYQFVTILMALAVIVYVLACWSTPSYGMSFGAREFVEFLWIPAIGITFSLNKMKKKLAIFFILLLLVFTSVNQVQAYQYRNFILLWDGMSKYDYWDVFLKTGKEFNGILWERYSKTQESTIEVKQVAFQDFESAEQGRKQFYSVNAHSGLYSEIVGPGNNYSSVILLDLSKINRSEDSCLQVTTWYSQKPGKAVLAIQFEKNGQTVGWSDKWLAAYYDPKREWIKGILKAKIPADATSAKIFVMNTGKEKVLVDDIKVDLVKFTNKADSL